MDILRHWIGPGHCVIDVGCGSGLLTDFCKSQGNQVIGIDITSQVKTTRTRSLDVVQGDIEQVFPFPDETFSLAICIEVVEHLLQPDRMLGEIYRVLKPGGILILSTPNYAYWVLRVLYLFGQLPVGLPGRHYKGLFRRVSDSYPLPWRDPHIRFFSPSIIKRFLNEYGFQIESIRASFVAFPSGLAPYLPFVFGLPLRVVGKLIGNLTYLGDIFPSLLAAGLFVKAIKR